MRAFRSAMQSIRQNPLRTALAGFGIAWGIFLLVVFLGIGHGFRAGVTKKFDAFARKSLFVNGGTTSLAGPSLAKGTEVTFDKDIDQTIRSRYGCAVACAVQNAAPAISLSHDGETVSATVSGVSSDYFSIRLLKASSGRMLTRLDETESRNVAVIGEELKSTLFGRTDALGQTFTMEGAVFTVIGIISSEDLFSMSEKKSVYIPITSFDSIISDTKSVPAFSLSLTSGARPSRIEKDLRGFLAYRYGFDAHDEAAVHITNIEKQTESFNGLFRGLKALIWIIGLCLLLSGIAGVCNVMLIIVKERTSEIGIRKAVGATSGSVIKMILAESLTITFIAGVIGTALGFGAVALANRLIVPTLKTSLMADLTIEPAAIAVALAALCLCGILAGLFPALKAAKITPVEAIRYEIRG